MKEKLKIFWGVRYGENCIGNAYGYRTHENLLRKYVSRIATLVDSLEEADAALYITSPDLIRLPEKSKIPIFLFTMFEGNTIPEIYKEQMKKADYFIAPSTFVKENFDKYFDPSKSFVVSHGVEKDFKFKKRKFPRNKPFRYLWLGAPNPRKGFEELSVIWKESGFFNYPQLELYLKTTRVGGVHRNGNVVLDGRDLSQEEMIKLYHSAHCFVCPTRGEGFGLTLAEAMSTGLPCIATNYSGPTDFFSKETGYPVGYELGKEEVTFVGDKRKEITEIAFPDVKEIAFKMIRVYKGYDKALRKGAKASFHIKRNFTWEKSAFRLVKIMEENYGTRNCG